MFSLRHLAFALLFPLLVTGIATAQDSANATTQKPSSLTITATASAGRVRITAPSSIVQMHVEVYTGNGEKLFDNEIRGGNVFDWHLQDGQAQRLSVGDYQCVVTIKNIAGRITQKLGTVKVGEQEVSVSAAETAQLTPQQSQAIGPIEDNSSWTVLDGKENQTPTVIAHDGTDGQIVRGRGALSFRIGDFFSGSDKEQMRLTEEGNLGIGTAKPKARLDVAGTIRAREGFMFSDGSTLNVNDKGVLTRTSADGTNTVTTTTQNRIAKFTDNAGTLGDAVAIDTGTGLQLTAAPSLAVDTNLLYLNSTNGTTGVLAGSTPSFGANNGPFFAMRGNTYATIGNQRGLFTISAGNVSSPVGDDGSVKFNTGNDQLRMVIRPGGNVGIGTSNPQSLLDVAGNINTSTQYNIGGSRVLSVPGTANTFAGLSAGANTTGTHNSFFGSFAGANSTGNANSFFGLNAGVINTTGSLNTAIGYFADPGSGGLENTTAVGALAFVTQSNSLVLGSINGVNGATADTNVGIGTTFPLTRLDVRGDLTLDAGTNPVIYTSASIGEQNRYLALINSLLSPSASGLKAGGVLVADDYSFANPGKNDLIVKGRARVGSIPPLPSAATVCFNAQGDLLQCGFSSLRWKNNVRPFLGGLDIIRQLRPINFNWKESGLPDIGLGAEDVAKVAPSLTFTNSKGEVTGVKYERLNLVLINGVKEQQAQIETLRTANASLNARLRTVERNLRKRAGSARRRR
jgi:hypothetical protein